MSQHDLTIDDQTTPTFRSDLNLALKALGSNSSGATAPATTFANQFWYDTAADLLKIRNEANSAWISLGKINQATGQFDPSLSGEAFVAGDLIYHNGTRYVRLAKGVGGQRVGMNDALTAPQWRSAWESSAAIATTSGQPMLKNDVPAWVTEIKLLFQDVSVTTNDYPQIRIGPVAGIVTTGYTYGSTNGTSTINGSSAFGMLSGAAARILSGIMTLKKGVGNTWFSDHSMATDASAITGGGYIALADTLTQIQLISLGGTFDNGSVTVQWR